MQPNPLFVLLLHHLARDVHLSRCDFGDARVRCRGARAHIVQCLIYTSSRTASATLAPQTHIQVTRGRNAEGVHFPRFGADPSRRGDGRRVFHERLERLRRHAQPGAVGGVDDLLHLEATALGNDRPLRNGERGRLAEAWA